MNKEAASERQQDCEGRQHPLWPKLSFSAQLGDRASFRKGRSGESAVSAIRNVEVPSTTQLSQRETVQIVDDT